MSDERFDEFKSFLQSHLKSYAAAMQRMRADVQVLQASQSMLLAAFAKSKHRNVQQVHRQLCAVACPTAPQGLQPQHLVLASPWPGIGTAAVTAGFPAAPCVSQNSAQYDVDAHLASSHDGSVASAPTSRADSVAEAGPTTEGDPINDSTLDALVLATKDLQFDCTGVQAQLRTTMKALFAGCA